MVIDLDLNAMEAAPEEIHESLVRGMVALSLRADASRGLTVMAARYATSAEHISGVVTALEKSMESRSKDVSGLYEDVPPNYPAALNEIGKLREENERLRAGGSR